MKTALLVNELERILGETKVFGETADLECYSYDSSFESHIHPHLPDAVVIPRAVEDGTFHSNPKRKRGNTLDPSLTLRVTVTVNRVRYIPLAATNGGSRIRENSETGRQISPKSHDFGYSPMPEVSRLRLQPNVSFMAACGISREPGGAASAASGAEALPEIPSGSCPALLDFSAERA